MIIWQSVKAADWFWKCDLFKKVGMALLIVLLLASCSEGDCILADDWGQNRNLSISIPAVDELTSGGIQVVGGQPLYLKAMGAVDLCPDSRVLDENTTVRISPQVSTWQTTGFHVRKGDFFSIYVHSAVNENEATPGSSTYMDRRANQKQGAGLYALIVEDTEDKLFGTPTSAQNSKSYYPDPTIRDDDTNDQFFELWENDPDNGKGKGSGIGGFSGIAKKTGVVWLRYARTASRADGGRAYSDSGDWESRWSPWRGRYAWGERDCRFLCNPGVFIPGCWATGPVLVGPCIAASFASCGAKKKLPDLQNCKWTPGDHWVDEDYNKNANGYEVEITSGCPGQDGTFLQAIIASDSDVASQEVPVFQPTGCLPGTEGCQPAVDGNGRRLTTPVYTLKPKAQVSVIEMDPARGANLNTQGAYDGTVPKSGNLWFRIVDRERKATDQMASPPNCDREMLANNTKNPNYIAPLNTPAGCVQHVHPEVNPDQKECDRNYVDGKPNPDLCSRSLLNRVTCQLADQNSTTKTYHEQCGLLNTKCIPPPGFTGYSDNLGAYKVQVRTAKVDNGFSSMANSIIKPVKAILFGACRANSSLTEEQCNALPSQDVPPPATLDQASSEPPCPSSADSSGTSTTSQTPATSNSKINPKPDAIVNIGHEVSDSPSSSWQPGIVTRMYTKLIGSESTVNPFVSAVRVALLLYIILHAFRYMLGLIEDPQKDFAATVIRIGILQQMLSPSSWEFFNAHLFSIFINGMNDLIAIFAGQFMGLGQSVLLDPLTGQVVTESGGQPVSLNAASPFAFVDQTLSRFFSSATWIKILALLTSPLGFMYVIFIILGMFFFIQAVLTALILYLLAMIAIGLQISLAPIFIAFMLFKRTRGFFENWVSFLLMHMLQPVLVLTALSMFNVFVYSAIYVLLHYSVCVECLVNISYDFKIFNIDICLFSYYMPWGGTGHGSIPVQFFMLLMFIIICQAMYSFNEWMARLASELVTGSMAVSLASVAQVAANTIKKTAIGKIAQAKDAAMSVKSAMSRKGGSK